MRGFPKKVKGRFDMRYTKIKNFKGVPELTEINDYAFAGCVYLQDEWMNYVQGIPDWEGLKKWNKKLLGLE